MARRETGEYSLSETTGASAEGLQAEVVELQEAVDNATIACGEASGWAALGCLVGVIGVLPGLGFLTCILLSFAGAEMGGTTWAYGVLFVFLMTLCGLASIPEKREKQRKEDNLAAIQEQLENTMDTLNAVVEQQLGAIARLVRDWRPKGEDAQQLAIFRNGFELTLIFNEGGVVLADHELDRLFVLKIEDTSDVQYNFDRKHLGSKSKSDSSAAMSAIGWALGAGLVGKLAHDSFDVGDMATAGVAGAIVGASDAPRSAEQIYEEHAVVDLYSTCNALPMLALDFGPRQVTAKRFYSYITNASGPSD